MRDKYFIGINNDTITQKNADQNAAYTIYANDEELKEIRRKLEKMEDASLSSFFRAHIPIKPYHEDPQNDAYDDGLNELFQMLYELGDEETKDHIRSLDTFS